MLCHLLCSDDILMDGRQCFQRCDLQRYSSIRFCCKAEGLDETDPFSAAHRLAAETDTAVPLQVTALETLPVIHKDVIAAEEMAQHIKQTLGIIQ